MLRVGFVVEGKSAEILFRENFYPWLQRKGITAKIINAGGRSRLIRDASEHLKALRLSGCKRIFFVLDQEADPCPPAAANRLGAVRAEPDVTVCVVARMLEAWLLADSQAVYSVTGQPYRSNPTDFLADPVSELKNLFFKKHRRWYTEAEMAKAIGRCFQLERAAKGNRSAARFLRKIEELVE
ncbi:MAG: DUF4276 family protein [Anaerolineae bacterium]|nr:DUF4276 family protein [Anaerolineae bacterium]MCX8068681.1 DUF4276 family protein [Anaerolineae bacterium]MDW7991441.1 DUF4276 family protein [Anaerolineae bacterium]